MPDKTVTTKTIKYIASWLAMPFLLILFPFFLVFALFDCLRPKWEE